PRGTRHSRWDGVGQLLQRLRRHLAVRRLQAERVWARAGAPGARPLHAGEERLDEALSVARVASFGEIADEFERRWRRTVWATMTTAGRQGRLQSRLVHPLWESSIGWVLTGSDALKARHLRGNSHTS